MLPCRLAFPSFSLVCWFAVFWDQWQHVWVFAVLLSFLSLHLVKVSYYLLWSFWIKPEKSAMASTTVITYEFCVMCNFQPYIPGSRVERMMTATLLFIYNIQINSHDIKIAPWGQIKYSEIWIKWLPVKQTAVVVIDTKCLLSCVQ